MRRWSWSITYPMGLSDEERDAIQLGRHQEPEGQFVLYTDHAAEVARLWNVSRDLVAELGEARDERDTLAERVRVLEEAGEMMRLAAEAEVPGEPKTLWSLAKAVTIWKAALAAKEGKP